MTPLGVLKEMAIPPTKGGPIKTLISALMALLVTPRAFAIQSFTCPSADGKLTVNLMYYSPPPAGHSLAFGQVLLPDGRNLVFSGFKNMEIKNNLSLLTFPGGVTVVTSSELKNASVYDENGILLGNLECTQ